MSEFVFCTWNVQAKVQDNVKMDIQEVRWGGMDWTDLAQEKGQVSGACECGYEPSGSIKSGEILD